MTDQRQPDPANVSDAHTERPGFEGRRALVTGGTTGIGRAIAVLLASEGAKVFVCGRTPEHLDDALARIREVGEGEGTNGDLAKPDDLRRIFQEADAYLGGLDIAIINAAIPAEALTEVEEDELRYQIEVDFTSYLVSTHHAAKRMGPGSDIVVIGSTSAVSRTGAAVYTAAKTAMQGFVPALRLELAEKDIKVGLIEPSKTGADFQYSSYSAEEQADEINAQRMLRAEDIAVAVQFMLQQPRRSAVSLVRVEPRLKSE